jgi:DNA-binding beta-propeller fold protein YncE
MDRHARARHLASSARISPLDGRDRDDLDAHLASCAACRAYDRHIDGDVAILRAAPIPVASPALRAAIEHAATSRHVTAGTTFRVAPSWSLAAILLALLGLLIIGPLLSGTHPNLMIARPSADGRATAPTAPLRGPSSLPTLPIAGQVVGRIPLPPSVTSCGMGSDTSCVVYLIVEKRVAWIVTKEGLFRLDLAQSGASSNVSIRGTVADFAIAGPALWVAEYEGDTVARVDPSSGAVLGRVKVGGHPFGLTAVDGTLWVSVRDTGQLVAISTSTRKVVRRIDGLPHGALVAVDGAIWILTGSDQPGVHATRVDLATGGTSTSAMAAGWGILAHGDLWIETGEGLTRVDHRTGTEIATVPGYNGQVASDGRWIWLLRWMNHQLDRVDPATNTVVAQMDMPLGPSQGFATPPAAIVTADGSIWIAELESKELLQIEPAS